jgi:hypothetical protein
VTFRVPGHLRLADHFASPAGGLISFRGQGVALVLQEHPLLDANRGGESLGLAAAVRDARALALPGTARVWRVRIGSLWGTRVRTALAVPTNGYREVAMLFGQRRSYILECLGQPLFQQVARRACDELLTTLRAA